MPGTNLPDDQVSYRHGERTLSGQQAQAIQDRIAIVVADAETARSNVFHIFETESDFISWASANRLRQRVDDFQTEVEKAQAAHERGEVSADQYQREARRIIDELDRLAQKSGLAPNSIELFKRATTHPAKGEKAVFDPAMLFARTFFAGRSVPLWGSCPDMRWLNFDKLTSSMFGVGEAVLFSGVAFRGTRFWILGTSPSFKFPTLGFFNGLTSSAVLLPH